MQQPMGLNMSSCSGWLGRAPAGGDFHKSFAWPRFKTSLLHIEQVKDVRASSKGAAAVQRRRDKSRPISTVVPFF